jgi:imidazole glycerol-phosphate synthase subunit HisH
MNVKVGIIDLNVGNIFSVIKAFKRLGIDFQTISNPKKILDCTHIVIPGVSAFKTAIESLNKLNLRDKIIEAHNIGKPLLGLCIGCQLLMDYSEEGGIHEGLGIIKGKVNKLPKVINKNKIKLPHVGWQSLVEENSWKNTLLKNLKPIVDDVYFTHSYKCNPEKRNNILATFDFHGIKEPAVIFQNNSIGIQFHPELSGNIGKKILNNFINIS